MSNKSKRNSFVEVLRIICIFGILLMHKNGFIIDIASTWQIPWIMVVNIFNFESSFLMLISAYYGNPYSSRKRLLNLWFMVLFYNYASMLVNVLIEGEFIINNGIEGVIRKLFPITSGTSWFACGYIVIWSFAPYIETIFEKLSRRSLASFVLLLAVLFIIIPSFTTVGPISGSGKDIGTLFTFYSIGRYIRRYGFRFKKTGSYVCMLLSVLLMQFTLNGICIWGWQIILGKHGVILPFSYDHSVFELLLAISLLYLSTIIYFSNETTNYIGKRAYGILLAEGLSYFPCKVFTDYQKLKFGWRYIFVVVVYVITIMLYGLLVESIRRIVFRRLEKKIVEKLHGMLNSLWKNNNFIYP